MDLDLNEVPLDQSSIESTDEHIEVRIRQLEEVTMRYRQRQRWRRGQVPVSRNNAIADTMMTPSVHDDHRREDVGVAAQEGVVVLAELTSNDAQNEGSLPREEAGADQVNNRKTGKRNSSHLVAQALGMDPYVDEEVSTTGNFFDCNICLDMVRDPILTCCGHLFCWPCFYQVSFAYSNVRECPVCKGEVAETGIIPIYGNNDDSSNRQLELKESGFTIPPRPQARRIESLRQQLISRGASSSTIQDIRRFIGFTATDRTPSVIIHPPRLEPQAVHGMESEGRQPNRLRVRSRSSQEGPAFSLLSSALNSAMEFVGDPETYIHPQQPQPIGSPRGLIVPLSPSGFSTPNRHISVSPPREPGSPLPHNRDTPSGFSTPVQVQHISVSPPRDSGATPPNDRYLSYGFSPPEHHISAHRFSTLVQQISGSLLRDPEASPPDDRYLSYGFSTPEQHIIPSGVHAPVQHISLSPPREPGPPLPHESGSPSGFSFPDQSGRHISVSPPRELVDHLSHNPVSPGFSTPNQSGRHNSDAAATNFDVYALFPPFPSRDVDSRQISSSSDRDSTTRLSSLHNGALNRHRLRRLRR